MSNEQQREYNNDVCKAKHKALEIKIDDNTKEIERVESDLKKSKEELKSEISTTKLSISNNLDKVDLTLRGNGKVGLQEQVRSTQKHIRVIYACIILLFGFKIFGTGLNEVIKGLVPKPNKEIKQVEIPNDENELIIEDKVKIKEES